MATNSVATLARNKAKPIMISQQEIADSWK